jgi:toxin HigB-1
VSRELPRSVATPCRANGDLELRFVSPITCYRRRTLQWRGCRHQSLLPLSFERSDHQRLTYDVTRHRIPYMIRSFRDRDTEALFSDIPVRRFRAIERQARRKLLYVHRARVIQDLNAPPGNRLETLKGDRRGQYSIRVNDQWRICFTWRDGDAHDVEIVDYH